MPVRYLSDVELARLSSWPGEIAEEDAVTFFTLGGDDLGWVRGFNRDENRLGRAAAEVLRPAGRFPRGRAEVDDDAVAFVARQARLGGRADLERGLDSGAGRAVPGAVR